jgi:cell division septation protein DedD
VSDITHQDLGDDGFHEIQLSGKQLVFLFMATTIVAVVIFLCGVQVGRGVRTDRVADATDPIAVATAPSTPATPPSTVAAAGPPAAEPPAPAQEAEDELTYAQRLQSDRAPKEQLKTRNEPAPAPVAAASEAVKSTPPASVTPPTSSATSARPALPVPNAPAPSRSGAWVIQVHALTDRASAAAIARRLTGKGYPAFVLDPSAGAPAIYRVQVGRYKDRHEAEQVARRLEKEEQFKPWVQH